MNRRIRSPEVRLMALDGHEIGLTLTAHALRMAKEQGLELLMVNPNASPPVCRLMDFGRFKFESVKRDKASRRAVPRQPVKHVKLTPTTNHHDLGLKLDRIRRFLREGHKCMVTVVPHGRERVHPETGQAMLHQIAGSLGGHAIIEGNEQREDGTLVMLLAPPARSP